MATTGSVRVDPACYRAAFEEAPLEAVILDERGVIIAANRAWREYGAGHGGRADGYLGASYLGACPPEDPAARGVREGIGRILAGSSSRFEQEYACPDGDHNRWFLLEARACAWDGRQGVLVTHSDVTRRFEAEHRSDHDPVTGLLTRRAFADRFRQALARAERAGQPPSGGALILISMDELEDLIGTPEADCTHAVLRALAERLRRELRLVDAIAGIGKAEFVLLAEDIGGAGAQHLAGRLLRSMEWPLPGIDARRGPGCSIGISHFPEDGATPARLILAADRARRRARRGGQIPIGSTRD